MVASLLLVGACNDNVDIQQSYPFRIETMPVPKKLKVVKPPKSGVSFTGMGGLRKQSISSAISSRTGREHCKCPMGQFYFRMTCTRFRVKHSGFIILPHRPTNKR